MRRAWSLPLVAIALAVAFVVYEARSSRLQAYVLSRLASELTFQMLPGPCDSVLAAPTGPYDARRGYALIPSLTDSLRAKGFRVLAQARPSARLVQLARRGIHPIYHETAQAGLKILDRREHMLYRATYPERAYATFDSIPDLLVKTLLFIENRELLAARSPRRNPAVEWDRLAKATVELLLRPIDHDRRTPGGSTLATQIEKFRHSEEGRTATPQEKVRQIASASLRAYLDGENTVEARRGIVLDFMNSVPLGAIPGYGEVNGFEDGLALWFDTDAAEVNRLLVEDTTSESVEHLAARALAYRKALSLFVAHRRPTTYLVNSPALLNADVEAFLALLAEAGVITPALRDAALLFHLAPRGAAPDAPHDPFARRKAANAVRARLLALTGLDKLYALDRLDLTVATTLDRPTQEAVTDLLGRLTDPSFADSVGLRGEKLLEHGDPAGVVYSFVLYERVGERNFLRVQADNFDQPFDINEGVKLDLGSTAKLRTLVHYLEIVAELHRRFTGLGKAERDSLGRADLDRLSRWALEHVASARDTSLAAMLDAAMERRYSASPHETFFTGGGTHTFENFEKTDNTKILSVREGIRNSVNLVFIRLMRDIVQHEIYALPGFSPDLIKNRRHPGRAAYLARSADREGREVLSGYYRAHQGKPLDASMALLLKGKRRTPKRLAVVFRSVRPDAGFDEFRAFLESQPPAAPLSEKAAADVFRSYPRDRFDLADRGYLAGVHPLELWLVEFLSRHPDASWAAVVDSSAGERVAASKWLLSPRARSAQDRRIRILLEADAFERIHAAWERVGYPFGSLVPSLATAIGSSADRPAALAELVGIIVNGGMRYETVRIERLHFARGTPYETILARDPAPGERVLPAELADVVRRALLDVVAQGTARRAANAFRLDDGRVIPVGGKTGTGDHRFETFGRGGRLIESRVMNRTATFVFLVGDRFFGVVSAHVPGPKAAEYGFTSSLPTQILRALGPSLRPLIEAPAEEDGDAGPDEPRPARAAAARAEGEG
jgi:membrane peptidoglycan carboxypeptidase